MTDIKKKRASLPARFFNQRERVSELENALKQAQEIDSKLTALRPDLAKVKKGKKI